MSFATKPPSAKDQSPSLPVGMETTQNSGALPNYGSMPAHQVQASAQNIAQHPLHHFQQASALYQQVQSYHSGTSRSFQSVNQRFMSNEHQILQQQQQQPQPPSITISKVPATVPQLAVSQPIMNHVIPPPKVAGEAAQPPAPAIIPQVAKSIGPVIPPLATPNSPTNNVASKVESSPPPSLPAKTSPAASLPPIPVFMQKTPTKSTLRLATVTPRIKTTPKKPIPTQLTPKTPPVPTTESQQQPQQQRPSASPQQKELTPSPAKIVMTPIVSTISTTPNVPSTTSPKEAPKIENNAAKESPKETTKEATTTTPKESPKVDVVATKVEISPKVVSAEQQPTEKTSPVAKKSPVTKPEPAVVVEKQESAAPKTQSAKTPRAPPKIKSDVVQTPRSKRARKGVQPFQSPIPEIENVKKLSIATSNNKSSEDKLTIFYKNEFLAVRNAEGSFYLCQAIQNVTKKGQKIKIRWLNEQKPGSRIYVPDYYDKTDFECVLTTVELQPSGKTNFKIPDAEQKRVEHILKNALDVEKGIVPKPEITEENPDGLDLSIYTSESQLERSLAENVDEKKSTSKRKLESEDSDDEDVTPLAKVAKTSQKSSAGTSKAVPNASAKKSTRGKKDDDPLKVEDKSLEIAKTAKVKAKEVTKEKPEKKVSTSTRPTRSRK